MTPEEIIEGNKRIVEFMGFTPNPIDRGFTYCEEATYIDGELYGDEWKYLIFHKSWDRLMPVVKKIIDKSMDLDEHNRMRIHHIKNCVADVQIDAAFKLISEYVTVLP